MKKFIETLKNIWHVEDLRIRLLITILFIAIYRFGSFVVLPGIDPQRFTSGNEDILYPKWTKAHYKGGEAEYERLLRARHINEDAANASASWGMFQIMGFNHAACGEPSVASFVSSMCQSECRQLLLCVHFIRGNRPMLAALQKKDWKAFARLYNGPAYAQNRYDEKLSTAYSSFNK